MISLRELQAAMAAALDGAPAAAAELIHAGGLAAGERIDVYANNAWSAFRNTLELAFPVVRRLGGEEWFRGAARAYRRAHPSRTGDLHWAGRDFAAFLRRELAGSGYDVIAAVAAFEWAYQEVLVAADPESLDLGALADVPEREYGALRFPLAPNCRLVASPYPVLDVWLAHRGEDEPRGIDLASGSQQVLLRRRHLEVELHRLDPATHALLAALASDAPLETASEAAFALDPDFPLAAVLQRQVALQVLTRARLAH